MQKTREYGECLDTVMKYIREHLNEPLHRDVLAGIAGFSVPHFHRIFTTHTGENISDYVRRVRLERAARKLRMGAVNITEVALADRLRYTRCLREGIQTTVWLQPQRVPSAELLAGH